jgi:hypothetical protein
MLWCTLEAPDCNGGSNDGRVRVREMRYERRFYDVRKVRQRTRASNDRAPGRIKRSRCAVPRRPWQSEVTDVLRAGYDLYDRGWEDLDGFDVPIGVGRATFDVGVVATFTTARKHCEREARSMAVGDEGPFEWTSDEVFAGKRVAVFSMPGAFTRGCSADISRRSLPRMSSTTRASMMW